MSLFKKFEEEAAPIPTPAEIFKEYSDSLYVCFYIDPNIYDPKGFTLSHTFPSNLSYKDFKLENNLHVFCVYCDGLIMPSYETQLGDEDYSIIKLYQFLYEGNEVSFDLCNSKTNPCFEIKNYDIKTKETFVRKIKF